MFAARQLIVQQSLLATALTSLGVDWMRGFRRAFYTLAFSSLSALRGRDPSDVQQDRPCSDRVARKGRLVAVLSLSTSAATIARHQHTADMRIN